MRYSFGIFELDLERRELSTAGVVIALEPKVFSVLVHLLTHRDRAVTKAELFEVGWPEAFVSDAVLTRCVRLIRRAVNDDGIRQRVIKTLRGYGYRFVATVENLAAPLPPSSPPEKGAIKPARVEPPSHMQATAIAGLGCSQCQASNRPTRQFCASCGHQLWQPCPHCGFGNDPTERFCGGCGQEVLHLLAVTAMSRTGPPRGYTPAYLTQRILARLPHEIGERKQVSVVSASIDGLQALRGHLGMEALDEVLNRGFALLVREVHRVEGFVSQVLRHGFTALFGAPLACEDHVIRALNVALGIQGAFNAYTAEVEHRHGIGLSLRLGVHTGVVVVNSIHPNLQLAYATPGEPFAGAASLAERAEAGGIWVSEAVQQQASGFFDFTDQGTHRLRDVAEPVRVYAYQGRKQVTSRLEASLVRGRTAFHGRRQELSLLQACWERARQGNGQVVCLVGEAGIGKSRLAHECQQGLTEACRLTVQTLSYGQAMPYHAFIPLLRTLLGLGETDDAEQIETIRSHLVSIDASLSADAPPLASLLGVPLSSAQIPALAPKVQRRRLQQACLQVLIHPSASRPLCLLVEDGHWLDPSSQELLDLLVASLSRRPILIVCTARLGFRHRWIDIPYFHQIAVEPLREEEIEALLGDLMSPYGLSPALKALLHQRTGGNPLFIEEMVRMLQAEGCLTVQGHEYDVSVEMPIQLPVSIQGIVQARLDALPAQDKQLVQVAAVVGRDIPWTWLEALIERPEEALRGSLRSLQTSDFLYETRTVPAPVYTFKHALVQEAVYQSILPGTRQDVHARLVQVLEVSFPDLVENSPEILAHHCTEAALNEAAIVYWQRAGHRALDRLACEEAIYHLSKGLELLTLLPNTPGNIQHELDLRMPLGRALQVIKGYSALEVEQNYARVRTLCEKADKSSKLFPALVALRSFYCIKADYQVALELAQELISLTRHRHDPVQRRSARFAMGETLSYLGEFTQAYEHAKQALACCNVQQSGVIPGNVCVCLCLTFRTQWMLGFPDQALRQSRAAIELAHSLKDPFRLAQTLYWVARLHHFRREVAATHRMAEAALGLATEHNLAPYLGVTMNLKGWALAMQGQTDEGIALMQQSWSVTPSSGPGPSAGGIPLRLVEVYVHVGQADAGLRLVAQALERVERTGEREWEAELHRLRGELLQQVQGDVGQTMWTPEECFHRALCIARHQQAKSLELRAATSLARLWQAQDKRHDAHDLLAPVHGWFTEGFDTVDLQEAKSLLDALS